MRIKNNLWLPGLVIIGCIACILADKVFGTLQGVQFALFGIDDALLIAGGSALAGGLTDLFSGNSKQEQIDNYIKTLEAQKTKYAEEGRRRKMELMRMNEAGKKQRLTRANQRAAQAGMDPVASSYANEEDLDNNLYAGISQVDASTEQMIRDIDNKIAAIEADRPPDETGLEKFMGGALAGGSVGLGFANMLKNPMKAGADTAAQTTATQQAGVQTQDAGDMKSGLPELSSSPEKITLNANNNTYGSLNTSGFDVNDPAGVTNMFGDTPKKSKYATARYSLLNTGR